VFFLFYSINIQAKEDKLNIARITQKLLTLQKQGKVPNTVDLSFLTHKSFNKTIDPRIAVALAILLQIVLWAIKLYSTLGQKFNMLMSQSNSYLSAIKMALDINTRNDTKYMIRKLSHSNMKAVTGKVVRVNGYSLKIGGVGASTCMRQGHSFAMNDISKNTRPVISDIVKYLDGQISTERPYETEQHAITTLYSDGNKSINPFAENIEHESQEAMMYSIKRFVAPNTLNSKHNINSASNNYDYYNTLMRYHLFVEILQSIVGDMALEGFRSSGGINKNEINKRIYVTAFSSVVNNSLLLKNQNGNLKEGLQTLSNQTMKSLDNVELENKQLMLLSILASSASDELEKMQ
jgi:hypothetical protein